MDLHPVTAEIQDLLARHGCRFETFEHEPVRTSEEAARTRPGYTLRQGAKALIMRVRQLDGDKRFVMLVMPADRRLDNQKARHVLQAKDIRFAREEEIATLTNGVQVGAVPPFGNLFGLDVIADPGLFDNERIVFNAGDRRFSVAMRSDDFQRIARPRIADITAAVVRDDIDGLDDRGEKRQAAFDRILGAESASLPRDPANLRAELDEAHDRSGR